jgi:hypothetical protein
MFNATSDVSLIIAVNINPDSLNHHVGKKYCNKFENIRAIFPHEMSRYSCSLILKYQNGV